MKKLFSPGPLWQDGGLFTIRIITGYFIVIHGWEVFDAARMKEYASWEMFQSSAYMPYIGKVAEFVAGILLLFGLFTRVGCIIIIGTFGYITFFVGKGKFWMDDQYPFLFVMLALVFFFTGPGKWSVDQLLLRKRR